MSMARPLRGTFALLLCHGASLAVRWIASEVNYSDWPSRGQRFPCCHFAAQAQPQPCVLARTMLHRSTRMGAGVTSSPRPHVLLPSLPQRSKVTALLAAPAPSRIPAALPQRAGVKQAEEKSSLAVRRRAALGHSLVLRESLSLMQSSAISPSTAKEYAF